MSIADDEKLLDDAAVYVKAMMGALSNAAGGKTLDARSVANACGQIAGSYTFGIKDAELKRASARHWAEAFLEYAGVPLKVVDVS